MKRWERLAAAVLFLVGIGGAPLMSMKMGQGDNKAAERILANCFLMLALCSVLMVACIYPIRIPMLRYFWIFSQISSRSAPSAWR